MVEQTSSPIQHHVPAKAEAIPQLSGRWLTFARVTWVILALLVITILVTSLPGYVQAYRGELDHVRFDSQTTTTAIIAVITILASLASALLSLVLATIFYRRRFAEPMVALLSFFLLLYAMIMAGPLEAWSAYWLGNEILALRLQGLSIAVPSVALFVLFPNGRFVPGWTRWLLLLTFLWSIIFFLLPSSEAAELFAAGSITLTGLVVGLIVLFVGGLYAQIYRYRHVSTPAEQQQTKWVMYGFVIWLVYIMLSSVPYYYLETLPAGAPVPWWASLSVLGWFLSLNLVPVSIAIAITRHNLWDIDLVINRTLVYAMLTALVIGIYVLVVGAMGTLFQAQGNLLIALIATGLVAVLFQPLRDKLQRGVNRMLYGQRDEPFEVLAGLGQQLEEILSPGKVYPTIVETVAQTLKLPFVALNVKKGEDFEMVVSYGKPTSNTQPFPLTYQGEVIGELVAGRRAANDNFSPADERLIRNIARQAGTAVHALQLATDLQQARQQVVTGREEERRRLRRDLHDGLGPSLAAQMLKIGSARALLADRPEMTDQLLAEMETDIENTLSEVRRIVYDLRPPALDQWGLAGAIRAYAEACESSYGNVDASRLVIKVETPESLPLLPAAVEVAAYHIAREGLANVMRHAQAGRCTLTLAVNEYPQPAIILNIQDDGRGFDGEAKSGVGLAAMRERAAELGGVCTIDGRPGAGTAVKARLPL